MQILILTCILKGKSLIINFQNIYLNNFAYSFHNKLKTTYLNGKVNRRVDFLLNILFQIEEDSYFSYQRKSQLPVMLTTQNARHQHGMNISAQEVKV